MSRFVRKFCFWNESSEHYEYANTFFEAIEYCEIAYGFKDLEWLIIKESNDFNMLVEYLECFGIEVEMDIDKEMKYYN